MPKIRAFLFSLVKEMFMDLKTIIALCLVLFILPEKVMRERSLYGERTF